MDIKCVVCGEPWDSYGVRHGDMLPWEAKLFKQGAGCPCCEGEPNGFSPETLSDIENGDEDPMDRIIARENHENGKAPKWERPEDPLIWECDGCGVQVIRDVDSNELEYRAPFKSLASYRRAWSRSDATMSPEHTFEDGTRVCEDCYHTCDHCNEPIAPETGYYIQALEKEVCSEDCLSTVEDEVAQETWRTCYSDSERLAYIRDHRDDFNFHDFADLMGCVRGKYFSGYASELLGT